MLEELSRESKQAELKINITKTKILAKEKTDPFKIKNQNTEIVPRSTNQY